MKNLYKYIKNGPASLTQLGLWTNPEGQVFTGRAAFLSQRGGMVAALETCRPEGHQSYQFSPL